LATFDVIDDPELLRGVRELGARLRDGLEALNAVTGVRGRGLMLGAALVEGVDAPEIAGRALEEGLIVNPIGKDTLRFLPPLIVSQPEVDEALGILANVVDSA